MCIRFFIVSICLSLLPQFLTASEHSLQLSLSKEVCAPGDVIELHAVMSRSDYAEFELKIPKVDALHLVTQQYGPIKYSKGFYRQNAIWVFQPLRSGHIEWTGIRAILKKGETETEHALPPLSLRVIPYQTTVDSLNLEPLQEVADPADSTQLPLWVYAVCLTGILITLYCALQRKLRKEIKA
ncbi:MAG: hypothetical protein ACPGSB_05225 [Opitutales bacterium]